VTYVAGLDQRRVAYRKSPKIQNKIETTPPTPLTPDDLEAHYSFPPGDGEAQIIAIAEFGGGYFSDDLNAFCTKFNKSVPQVQVKSINLTAFTFDEINKLPLQQQQEELGMATEVDFIQSLDKKRKAE
jgi:kumamolisin